MFNNREIALLFWFGMVLAFVLVREDLRPILLDLLRTALKPGLAVPVCLMAAWVGAVVFAAFQFGVWETGLLMDTSLWFFGTALAIMFSFATTFGEGQFVSRTLARALKVAILVEAFIGLYVFSLPVEVLLLPGATVLVMLSAVAGNESRHARVKTVLDIALALVGFALIAYVVWEIAIRWETFDSTAASHKLALPYWLTIGIVPLVYVFSLYAAYESVFARIDSGPGSHWQRWRAKLALIACLGVRTQEIAGLRPYWAKRLATSASFREATMVVHEYSGARRADRIAKRDAEDRLKKYANVSGVGEGSQVRSAGVQGNEGSSSNASIGTNGLVQQSRSALPIGGSVYPRLRLCNWAPTPRSPNRPFGRRMANHGGPTGGRSRVGASP
jgi:hypothetical protein